ncbi:hypothetical protein J2Z44_001668 [Clostridium punense]|uniref:Uncharacterized protein n=1 Tax=Clostridium punense TaxID=1054297 RepID=A0ABS4K262_9CLOT|nr:hypothetical protein M918_01210 [Clostridium sp. BL8]MBP2021872.1 hypothetical protein [Clostridium punense]
MYDIVKYGSVAVCALVLIYAFASSAKKKKNK